MKDLVVSEVICDGLIVTLAAGDQLPGGLWAVERDHQLFVPMLSKCQGLLDDVAGTGKGVGVA